MSALQFIVLPNDSTKMKFQFYKKIKGRMSRRFSGFLVQTILKLVLDDLTCEKNIFEHLKEDMIFLCEEKSNHDHYCYVSFNTDDIFWLHKNLTKSVTKDQDVFF